MTNMSKDLETCDGMFPAGAGAKDDVSATKQARIREKNRRASLKFRMKHKSLEADLQTQIDTVQDRLKQTHDRSTALRESNKKLSSRLSRASHALLLLHDAFACYCSVPGGSWDAARATGTGSGPFGDHTHAEEVLQGLREPPWLSNHPTKHVLIQTQELLLHPPNQPPQTLPGRSNSNDFLQLLARVKRRKLQQMQGADAVCWRIQCPFEVASDIPLSYSTSLHTPACISSLLLSHVALSLELSMLHMETGAQAASSATKTSVSVLQQLPVQLEVPAATVCSSTRLTCGVSGSLEIREGSMAVIRSILRRYKPRVPSDSWLRVCASMAHTMHTVQCGGSNRFHSNTTLLDAPSQNNTQNCQHAVVETEEGSAKSGTMLPGVLVAVAHAVGSAIREELHACDAGWSAQGEPRRKEAAMRLQHLSHHRGVSKVLIYEECPLLARQIELALTAAAARTFEQGQKMHRDAFAACAFNKPQKAALARMWYDHRRARHGLQAHLSAALAALEELPRATDVPPALLQFLTSAADNLTSPRPFVSDNNITALQFSSAPVAISETTRDGELQVPTSLTQQQQMLLPPQKRNLHVTQQQRIENLVQACHAAPDIVAARSTGLAVRSRSIPMPLTEFPAASTAWGNQLRQLAEQLSRERSLDRASHSTAQGKQHSQLERMHASQLHHVQERLLLLQQPQHAQSVCSSATNTGGIAHIVRIADATCEADCAECDELVGYAAVQQVCEDAAAVQLMGMGGASSVSASKAVDSFARMQTLDIMSQRDVLLALSTPSAVLTRSHNGALASLALEHGLMRLDMLALCAIAADEERHCELLCSPHGRTHVAHDQHAQYVDSRSAGPSTRLDLHAVTAMHAQLQPTAPQHADHAKCASQGSNAQEFLAQQHDTGVQQQQLQQDSLLPFHFREPENRS